MKAFLNDSSTRRLMAVAILLIAAETCTAQSPSLQRIALQEQSEIEKLRMEMRRAELDLGVVRADARGQILNQRVTQAEIKQLRTALVTWDRHIQSVRSFATHPSGVQKGTVVLGLLRSVRVVGSLAEIVDQDAPPIAADNFEPHLFRGVVESTGELLALPDGLLEFVERKGHATKLAALQSRWSILVNGLVAEGTVSASHRQALLRQLKELRRIAATATPTIRAQTNMILERIEKLVNALRHRMECQALSRFLENRGHAFAGGTVGALLEHVVAYGLVPRQASVPQRLLSKLATVLAQTASHQSCEVRKRLDKLLNNGSLALPEDASSWMGPMIGAALSQGDGGSFPSP